MALGVLAVATALEVPPVPGVPGLRSNLLLLPPGVMEEPGEPGGAGGPLSPGVDEEIHKPGVENPYPGVTDLIGFGDDLIGTGVGDDLLGTGVGEAPLSTGTTDSPLGPGVGEAPRPEAVEPATALALLACSSQWGRGGSLLVLAVFGVAPVVAGVLVGWWSCWWWRRRWRWRGGPAGPAAP